MTAINFKREIADSFDRAIERATKALGAEGFGILTRIDMHSKIKEKTGITVELQQRARVDFQLTVGSTTESVQVVASAVALKTEDASIGQVIDNKRVIELPLNGRNISALAVLTPGVQFGSQRSGEDGQGGQPRSRRGIRF